MTEHVHFQSHNVIREGLPDGTILLHCGYKMSARAVGANEWLERWTKEASVHAFLAERSEAGWTTLSVGEALAQVREPPNMGESEVTPIGNLNFAKTRKRRAELVARLYDDDNPASIVSSK